MKINVYYHAMVLECFAVSIIALFLDKQDGLLQNPSQHNTPRILYHLAPVAIPGQQAYNFDIYCHIKYYLEDMSGGSASFIYFLLQEIRRFSF